MPTSKKTFSAVDRHGSGPVWAPLLALVGPLLASSFICLDDIVELENGQLVHVYRHEWTQRNLMVTLDGATFEYTMAGRYHMIPARAAVRTVFTPWYRLAGGPTVEESVMIDRILDGLLERTPAVPDEPSPDLEAGEEPITAVVDIDANLLARVRRSAPRELAPADAVRHALRLYALDREMKSDTQCRPLGAGDAAALSLDEASLNARRPAPPACRWRLVPETPFGGWHLNDRFPQDDDLPPSWSPSPYPGRVRLDDDLPY